jgi:hypothetical protein
MSGRLIHSETTIHRWLAVLIALVFAAVPLLADAGPKVKCPKKPKKAYKVRKLAKRFFTKGGRFAQKEKFEAALDSFLCSLKMRAHVNTVYNVAQVSKFIADREHVLQRLEQFVERHPDHESNPEIIELIESVEGVSESPGLKPEPDEAPAVMPPDPGAEAVEQEGPPADPVVDELFGEDLEQPGKEPDKDPGEQPEPTGDDEGEPPPLKTVGYVMLGTAGASLIFAISLQAAAGAAKNDALDSTSYDQFTFRKGKMKRMQAGATVCWVATGLLAGTGVVLLLLDRGDEDPANEGVDIALEPGVSGITLRGRF